MDFIKRDDIKKNALPGRVVQNAVGHNSAVLSEKMTVSFCHYSAESGPMEPHNHAEESVVVLSCGTCSATKRAAIWTPCASTAR